MNIVSVFLKSLKFLLYAIFNILGTIYDCLLPTDCEKKCAEIAGCTSYDFFEVPVDYARCYFYSFKEIEKRECADAEDNCMHYLSNVDGCSSHVQENMCKFCPDYEPTPLVDAADCLQDEEFEEVICTAPTCRTIAECRERCQIRPDCTSFSYDNIGRVCRFFTDKMVATFYIYISVF